MGQTGEDLKLPVSIPVDASTTPVDALRQSIENLTGAVGAMGEGMKKAQQPADDLKKKGEETGKSFAELKRIFLKVFAFAEIATQFKEGLAQFEAAEQAQNRLRASTERLGQNYDQIREKINEQAEAMKRAAGVDDDTMVPAMIRVYEVTGNVETALAQAQLAGDLYARGIVKDLVSANDLVFQASMGNVRAMKELGFSFDETEPKSARAAKALEQIAKLGAGGMENAKGLAVEIRKLGEAWEDFRGNAIEPSIPLVKWLLKAIPDFGGMAVTTFKAAGIEIKEFWDSIKAMGEGMWNFARGGGLSALRDSQQEILRINKEAKEKADKLWEEAGLQHEKIWSEHQEKMGAIDDAARKARIRGGADDVKQAKATQSDLLRITAERYRAEAHAAEDFYQKDRLTRRAIDLEEQAALLADEKGVAKTEAEKAQIRAKFDAMRRASIQAMLKAVQKQLDDEVKAQLDADKARSDSALKIAQYDRQVELLRARQLSQAQALEKKMRADLDQWIIEQRERLSEDAELRANEEIKLKELIAEREKEITETVAKTKMQAGLEVAAQSVAMAQKAFGDSAILAHAAVAIDTAQAIMNIWSKWAALPVVAAVLSALAVATGIAQHVAIDKAANEAKSQAASGPATNPTIGRGFDDPLNDSMFYTGARRWAKDLMREMSAGVRDGFSSGGGERVQNSYSTQTTNVHLHNAGFYDVSSAAGLAKLQDALDLVNQGSRRRRVTGTALR